MAYLTPEEVREAIEINCEITEPWLEEVIKRWSQWIDRWTGRFFEVRSREFKVFGSGSLMLQLDQPPADANIELFMNDEETTPTDPTYYMLYGTPDQPEEQTHPRIILKRNGRASTIFTGSVSIFHPECIQTIKGNFGFVDESGNPPELIKHALLLLIERQIRAREQEGSYGSSSIDRVIKEVTDRHSYELGKLPENSYWFPTGNPEIDQIIMMFRRPSRIEYSCNRD